MLIGICALASIATSYAIADELYFASREGVGVKELTIAIEYETSELRKILITFNTIHRLEGMSTARKCGSHLNERVTLASPCRNPVWPRQM